MAQSLRVKGYVASSPVATPRTRVQGLGGYFEFSKSSGVGSAGASICTCAGALLARGTELPRYVRHARTPRAVGTMRKPARGSEPVEFRVSIGNVQARVWDLAIPLSCIRAYIPSRHFRTCVCCRQTIGTQRCSAARRVQHSRVAPAGRAWRSGMGPSDMSVNLVR